MTPLAVALAMLLDAVFGEPKLLWDRTPHPAVWIGRIIAWADHRWNTAPSRKAKGTVVFAALILASGGIGMILMALPGVWAEILVGAVFLAQRSLVDHVSAVGDAVGLSVADGRLAVSNIVGRDTAQMDEAAVVRAAIESAAENFSDGLTAPVFWFLLGGLPGLLIYKTTNTADSMIGYLTPRHADFGWAAARFDDVLNWVPARLTAVVFVVLGGGPWRDVARDARMHRSPNAGWPEAAMARALDIALAGPRSYDGRMQDFAYVHPQGARSAGPEAISRAVGILWQSWVILLLVVLVTALI